MQSVVERDGQDPLPCPCHSAWIIGTSGAKHGREQAASKDTHQSASLHPGERCHPLLRHLNPARITTFQAPRSNASRHPVHSRQGLLHGRAPHPRDDQSLEEAYTEFIPVWGKPSPYYELADDLQGGWGDIFLRGLIWDAGMFPLVHMSFIDAGMTLKTPPDIPSATLSDPARRAGYKQAAIDIISTGIPMYLSLGNDVNRLYKQHSAAADDPSTA